MRPGRFAIDAKLTILAVLASLFTGFLLLTSPDARAGEPLQRLEFVTESGAHPFRVEVADSPQERAKGLMFRRSMPQDQGMLFDFHDEVPVMMWMKNTYIPLDMVFVSRAGVVTSIAAETTPMSEAVIDGGQAYAVIELNAGVAKQIGLKPGDEVRHGAFKH